MTLTIEVAPETQARLDEAAAQRGVTAEQLVTDVVNEYLQDLEQDSEDAEEARHRLATTKPEDFIPWEQLKAEIGQ